MSTLNSSLVLERLASLRRAYWLQDFTFTANQAAEWASLRQARWARVAEMQAAAA
jgi:hypothetical protein